MGSRPRLIGFSKPSNLIIFPLLIPILCCCRNFFVISLNKLYDDTNPNFNISKHPMMLGFASVFSDILSGGIFYLIHYYQSAWKKPLRQEELLFNKLTTKTKIKKAIKKKKTLFNNTISICLLLLNSVLECTFLTSFIILGNNMDNTVLCYQMNILLIILESVLCYKFLKSHLYRHKIVSLGVIIIGIIGICAEKFSLLLKVETLIALGVYVIISILDISQKWLMDKRFVNPYKLLMIQGIISSGLFLIAFSFSYIIPCPTIKICYENKPMEKIFSTLYEFFTSTDVNASRAILYYFCYYLTCGCYVVCVFSTIGFFSPTLRCMSDTLGTFSFWVILLIFFEEKFFYLTFIMNILIIFSYLIYNEIIILYFWGLNVNTAKEIDNRAKQDQCLAELNKNYEIEIEEIENKPVIIIPEFDDEFYS